MVADAVPGLYRVKAFIPLCLLPARRYLITTYPHPSASVTLTWPVIDQFRDDHTRKFERQTDRQTETEGQRETDTERQRQRHTQRDRQTETERDRDRQTERE